MIKITDEGIQYVIAKKRTSKPGVFAARCKFLHTFDPELGAAPGPLEEFFEEFFDVNVVSSRLGAKVW